MVFETKKLNTETLSEYLVNIRNDFKLSVEEVSKKTGIQKKFLESLELGKLNALPPDVYVLGFLRQLGELYAIEPDLLVQQYKKERAIDQQISRNARYKNSQAKKYLGRLVVTPKILGLVLGSAFVLLTIAYIVWQVFSINRTPSLEIVSPQDRQVISQTSVAVEGFTDPGMVLSLNDQNIFVDNQGKFKTQIGVEQGPKQLVFEAKNKFGKSISKTITVVGQKVPDADSSSGVLLEVSFSNTVDFDVKTDDGPVQSNTFHAGDKKTFTATSKLVVSTSDSGATSVVLNGQNMGLLGRSGEKLSNISFVPPAQNIKNNSK